MEIDRILPRSGRAGFRVQVQKTRVATYVIGCTIGVIFKELGVLDVTSSGIFMLGVVAVLTAVFFLVLTLTGVADRIHPFYDPLWMLADAALIGWAIIVTGGIESPWFPWFLANIGGAAFVGGQLAGFIVALLDTLVYVLALVHTGDITAVDERLYVPLARMAFLYGASFLFLRGVSLLKEKQHFIKTIRDGEMRKVDELTRLTSALDQRTRELEDANLRIREADRLKSQFLANMSHELRTPLNSIIGFSDVLINRLPEDLPDRFHKFLRNIHSSGQHLLGIINDLLDLSKIEAGKMELCPEPVEIALVVQGVCSIMQGSAASRHIGFSIDLPDDLPTVETDPVKIKQILFNLVSNAVKFSDEGSKVTIRACHIPETETSGIIQLSVIDTGVGIDPRDHRAIFEEFRQVDGSSSRAFGGTGLGLALVKRLVELHGGSITVESSPGKGSTFTVNLPVRFQGDSSLVVEPLPETLDLPGENRPKIVVVEDDPTAFELISSHLRAAGYIAVRARNGKEALQLAHQVKPAAITLDIILPGPDGWEVLKQLKADDLTAKIPVIVVSVLDNRELAVTLGAADYLTKPVQAEALINRLSEHIPNASGHRPHLLLIDDDPGLHDLVEAKLTSLGYTIEHALNGREGLLTANEKKPELIILDLMMEEMDGFEVAAKLKADTDTADIPVVVLTAKEMNRQDHDRLRGKIEALVGKVDIPGNRLAGVIERVLKEGRGERA